MMENNPTIAIWQPTRKESVDMATHAMNEPEFSAQTIQAHQTVSLHTSERVPVGSTFAPGGSSSV